MNPLRLAFVCLFGLSAALPAQDVAAHRTSPIRNPIDLTADYALVQREPDALWGLGRDYSVRFHDDRVEFVPHLPGSPVTQRIVLRATAVGRGAALAPFTRTTGPFEQGRRVSYLHEQATEVYAVRPDGMEQSFVFQALPAGEGDLVVTCTLATELPLLQQGADGLAFGNEHGGVRLSGVVGIDADGRRAPGSLAYADGELSLRLPAAFVQSAKLPLELDPVLSPSSLQSTVRIHEIEAAYDVTSGTYLVVWGTSWNSSASEIRGYLLPGGPVLIEPAAVNRNLSVANNNARDCFVVTWDTQRASTFFLTDVLRARVLRPGQLGATVDFPGIGSASFSGASVASSPSPLDDRMLMVTQVGASYITTPGQQGATLVTFQVSPSLGLFAAPSAMTQITTANVNATGVGISRSDDGQGRYLVAVGEEYPAGTHRMRCGVYDVQRGVIVPSDLVPAHYNGQFYEIAIDGSAGNWFVAATTEGVSSHRMPWRTQASIDNGLLMLSPTSTLGSNLGTLQIDVASTRRLHAVAYQARGYSPPCSTNCWVAGIATFTGKTCAQCGGYEEYADETAPAFARPAANGDPSPAAAETVKLFYANHASSTASTVMVGDYVPGDGIATDLGGGCGNMTASATWSCAKVADILSSSTFEAALSNAPASAFLVLSTNRLDASGCGTCTVVPNPWNGFVLAPPSGGRPTIVHTISLPIDPQLVGARFYQQWLALAVTNTGCPSLGLNLSNALRLEVQ
jgi:hypothetical protein